jgi:hypothetical protein
MTVCHSGDFGGRQLDVVLDFLQGQRLFCLASVTVRCYHGQGRGRPMGVLAIAEFRSTRMHVRDFTGCQILTNSATVSTPFFTIQHLF